jgi:hypothetical protein
VKTPPEDLSPIEADARRLAAAAKELADNLAQKLPRVREDIRAARSEADSLRAALEKEKSSQDKSRPAAASSARGRSALEDQQVEDAGALLAAPFRVSARAAAAARTEPLSALAVQVAKALSPDASPVERARLIAMAFAASQGDLESFWAARRQRKVGGKPIGKTPLRPK